MKGFESKGLEFFKAPNIIKNENKNNLFFFPLVGDETWKNEESIKWKKEKQVCA